MKGFEEWLITRGYAKKTIAQRVKDTSTYLEWLKDKNLQVDQSTYPVLMDYIGHQRKPTTAGGANKSETVIVHSTKAIGQYLDYKGLDNPTRNIKLRKSPEPKLRLLTTESLDQIFTNFQPESSGNNEGYYHLTDKLILGLIIYQALDVRDIYRLETDHLNLEKGTIYIKGSSKGNSRMLTLQPQQILPLHSYLIQTRPQLQTKEASTNYKPVKDSNKLFIPQAEKLHRVIYQWRKLAVKVKEQTHQTDHEVTRLQQLRQSCIAGWIKAYGLRKAQYMGGFRTVSGVERYRDEYLEDLKEQLDLFHPLRK